MVKKSHQEKCTRKFTFVFDVVLSSSILPP